MNAADRPSCLRVGAASHRGNVRDENQDRISRFHSAYGQVFLVVDGMGGHGDGGRAAEIAVEVLEGTLASAPHGLDEAAAMTRAVGLANRELLRQSALAGECARKMGATLVLALIEGTQARIAHAGDCRAYLVRGSALQPLTRDHTLVQQMVDAKLLSPEQARDHPEASVVTRALGQEESLALEIGEPLSLQSGDRLLLCSDGLTGYLGDAEIEDVLVAEDDVQKVTERLIALALAAGGEDNVSVQLIELAEVPPQAPAPPHEPVPEETAARKTVPSAAALGSGMHLGFPKPAGKGGRLRSVILLAGALVALAAGAWVWRHLHPAAEARLPTTPTAEASGIDSSRETGSDDVGVKQLPADSGQPLPGFRPAEDAQPPSTQPESDDEPDLPKMPYREP